MIILPPCGYPSSSWTEAGVSYAKASLSLPSKRAVAKILRTLIHKAPLGLDPSRAQD